MSKPMMGRLAGVFIIGLLFFLPGLPAGTHTFILSEAHLVGTDQLAVEDVIRGLNLKLGQPTTHQNLVIACEHFRKLKLFRSAHCRYTIHGHNIALDINVEEKWAGMPIGLPVVFDNFVWTTRADLLTRLKQEIPFFMPKLPESCGLTRDILRVLQQAVDERGIKGSVRYG